VDTLGVGANEAIYHLPEAAHVDLRRSRESGHDSKHLSVVPAMRIAQGSLDKAELLVRREDGVYGGKVGGFRPEVQRTLGDVGRCGFADEAPGFAMSLRVTATVSAPEAACRG
jgi:hypothetical protein